MTEFIPVAEPLFLGNEREYVNEAVESTWVSSGGKFLEKFEERFPEYCGASYGTTTTSGTTALHLAVRSLGIEQGDEVIVPSFTNVASALSVAYEDATPVFVDVNPDTWNMDIEKLKSKITSKTKAIMPVHIFGQPCDMEPIMELAGENDLFVIEDAAQAHGAEYKGKKAGSIGSVGCFSFYGNKIITTGEGGFVTTNDSEIIERARYYKNLCFGEVRDYTHDEIGYNYRMTNVQAALGLAQLEVIDEIIKRKRKIGKLYERFLDDKEGIKLQKQLPGTKSVYWMFPVLIEDSFGVERSEVQETLKERGIDTRMLFAPLDEQAAFRKFDVTPNSPVSRSLYEKGFYLPSGAGLTENQVKYISETLLEIRKS